MPDRGVGVTDQAPAAGVAEVRARERTISSVTYAEQYVIPISERVASFKGAVTSFRTPGRAALTQNIFCLSNTTGSGVLVAVRRLSIQQDPAAVLNTSWGNLFKVSRITTAPTNGTVLTKVAFDTSQSSSANVIATGDASADGTGSATTLTATAGTPAWHQFANRLHTAAGQVVLDDASGIPALAAEDPMILRANEHMLVSLAANATGANGATVMYLINCMWEEFTLP